MSRALGRYELLRPLARGGMGEVYLARRRAAGVEKWLVVKRMRPERAGDARFLDLFKREAKLSMSLAHQNIVPVFDFGRIDDQVFLAMERVEGKDLGSSLSRAGKPMPPMLAAFVAAECLQALDYAHHRKGPDGADLGIVHRDVTPRNVLLSWSGEVKLTDFGIALLAGDESSKTAGTPAYMAPEQARGEPTDPRADVYAVGLVLREAITGVRPRKGTDREGTIAIAQQGTLAPWPETFDSPLRALVDKATALAKEERFPDARSMLEELDAFIVSERASKKSEAPSRLLAAWLADVWAGARDDEPIDPAKIEAGEMLSFLDDGALDVMGTGTQRSMAATAADIVSEPAVDEAPPPRAKSPTLEPSPRAKSPTLEEPKPSSRRPLMLGTLIGLAIGGGALAYTMQRHGEPARTEPAAPQVTEPPPPVEVAKEPPVEVEKAGSAESAPVESGSNAIDDKPKPRKQTKRAEAKQAEVKQPEVVAPAEKKRKVVINTKPWSYFTVDGGSTRYQTLDPIELSPGAHRIHFLGNEFVKAERSVTIDVPEGDGVFRHVEKEPLEAPP
ncbi:MAG: protein kinase [Kofleriaceae bacterium]|nr:protein kinase [Kofleriaceae bacterium]